MKIFENLILGLEPQQQHHNLPSKGLSLYLVPLSDPGLWAIPLEIHLGCGKRLQFPAAWK